MKNIQQLQEEVESSIMWFSNWQNPPSELAALRHVLCRTNPKVSFRSAKGRKIREDAAADYFDRDEVSLVVDNRLLPDINDGSLAGDPSAPHSVEVAQHTDESMDSKIEQFVEALREAECGRDFVGLKWFRDQFLGEKVPEWADDFEERRATLQYALKEKLVLTNQVANPRNPLHPVTAIRLNRRHPRFVKHQERPAAQKRFRPARISGAALSETVIEGRR